LLIFGGLPGVGKTAVAAGLALEVGAVHLRIDSIEQALRNYGVEASGPEGYEVAYAIAEDNLRLGRTVIADSVNPVEVTRSAWRGVAQRAADRGDRRQLFRGVFSSHGP
jgi:predicted kinase